MMTIAIPLKAQNDYTELRFCLRSIEKFLPGLEVVIVGTDLPEWITNVTWLRVDDIRGKKQLTIKKKTWAALSYSKEVVSIHDDIYLLKPYEKNYYISSTLKTVGEGGARSLIEQLQALNKPINNYDCHSPIIYERDKFEALGNFTSDVVVKSAYGNYWEIEAQQMPDFKVNMRLKPEQIWGNIRGRPYFSTGAQGVQSCLPVFQELFSNKSKFEL